MAERLFHDHSEVSAAAVFAAIGRARRVLCGDCGASPDPRAVELWARGELSTLVRRRSRGPWVE
jgi:hypothetical protein